jgi:hypothetical protein
VVAMGPRRAPTSRERHRVAPVHGCRRPSQGGALGSHPQGRGGIGVLQGGREGEEGLRSTRGARGGSEAVVQFRRRDLTLAEGCRPTNAPLLNY